MYSKPDIEHMPQTQVFWKGLGLKVKGRGRCPCAVHVQAYRPLSKDHRAVRGLPDHKNSVHKHTYFRLFRAGSFRASVSM
jgi:hypothetical protein